MTEEVQQNTPQQPLRAQIFPLKRYCTRAAGSECKRCQLVCPHDAISFSEQNQPCIDDARCTRCGLCRGICDAFASERITLLDLADRAIRYAQDAGPLFFTCAEATEDTTDLHQNVFVLPCLASLPPELWAHLLLQGASVFIHCDFDRCKQCACAGPQAEALFSYAFSTAETWSGKTLNFSDDLPNEESVLEFYEHPDEMDRREIFSSVFNEASDIATGKYRQRKSKSQSSFHEQRERMKARGHIQQGNNLTLQEAIQNAPTKRRWARQQLLADALQNHPRQAAQIERWYAETNDVLCNKTKTCIDVCPTHARTFNEETQMVEADRRYCIACGACVNACQNHACYLEEGTALDLLDWKESDG